MASRFYLSNNAPGVVYHGPARGTWSSKGASVDAYSPVQRTNVLQASNVNAGSRTSKSLTVNQAVTAPYDLLFARFVTPALEAQTISGTLDLCAMVRCYWNSLVFGFTNDATAVYKVHAYIANGQATTVRHVLLDNYVDGVTFAGAFASQTWQQLSAPLSSGACAAGDVVVVELGIRVLTSPAHTVHYPPDEHARIELMATGANSAHSDAADGSTSSSLNPWLEFSSTLTLQAAPAAPANDVWTDAVLIESLPFWSDAVNASTSTDTANAVWWRWVVPETGRYVVHALGSNFNARIQVVYDSGGGVLVGFPGSSSPADPLVHRTAAMCYIDVFEGEEYFIRVYNANSDTEYWGPIAGAARLGLFKPDATAQENDLYLPNGALYVIRDGALALVSNEFTTQAPTGIAIDYSGAAMEDQNGGMHTGHRVLLGLHNLDIVEILDAATLNIDEFEIDYIADPIDAGLGIERHVACLQVNADGQAFVAFFGDGYHFVAGTGALPAYMSTVPSDAAYSYVREVNASGGDSQSSAPFSSNAHALSNQYTSPWAIALDEAGLLYYASSALYIDAVGQTTTAEIRTWNTNTAAQGALFATLTLDDTEHVVPGLRGLWAIPGGGLLVCNGSVVQRLDASGAIVQTYDPSIAEDSTSLCAVVLEADSAAFWVVDLRSTRLFKFDLATGEELDTAQFYGNPGTLVQMAIYLPNGQVTPPAPECPPLLTPVGCWTPGQTPLGCGPRTAGATGCWSGFSQDDLAIGRSS